MNINEKVKELSKMNTQTNKEVGKYHKPKRWFFWLAIMLALTVAGSVAASIIIGLDAPADFPIDI